MATQQLILLVVVNLVLGAIVVGLIVRERARHCWSFVAYLCGILIADTVYVRFYNQDFWMVKQALFDILRTATALEMTWRVVRAFPGALRIARRWALLLLLTSLVVLASGPHRARYAVVFDWQPRIYACTAMLFALAALLVAWYHLPVRRLHRAIMGGFAVYSAFFATLLSVLGRLGWGHLAFVNALDGVVYLAVCLYWLRAAWTREEEPMPDVDFQPLQPRAPAGIAGERAA